MVNGSKEKNERPTSALRSPAVVAPFQPPGVEAPHEPRLGKLEHKSIVVGTAKEFSISRSGAARQAFDAGEAAGVFKILRNSS
jgi:hypothetical protein